MLRKIAILTVLVLASVSACLAQGNTVMLKFAGAPSGACSFIMLGLNGATGALSTCPAGAWVSAGGGSGTVNSGTANQVAFYPATAAAVSGSTGLTYDQTHTLTISVAGNGNAVLGLAGNTSGTATCTAPAVAGTITNPVTCTNDLSAPGYSLVNGAAPASATGMFNTAAQNIIFDSNGTQWLLGNQNIVQANKPLAMVGGNRLFVTANFTTAANTSLQTITGLQFTHTSSNAINWNFHCSLGYSQATGTAAVAFGIQAATNNPTNIFATGKEFTAAGTVTTGVLATLTTTTATAIVSGTPGATGTNVPVELDGTLELAASANTINFMVSTATSADAVTILRGSYCLIF